MAKNFSRLPGPAPVLVAQQNFLCSR